MRGGALPFSPEHVTGGIKRKTHRHDRARKETKYADAEFIIGFSCIVHCICATMPTCCMMAFVVNIRHKMRLKGIFRTHNQPCIYSDMWYIVSHTRRTRHTTWLSRFYWKWVLCRFGCRRCLFFSSFDFIRNDVVATAARIWRNLCSPTCVNVFV